MDHRDQSAAQRRSEFQALVVAAGTALVPDGTGDSRIAALSDALSAPTSTVRKWFYGFSAPRGAALNLLMDRLRDLSAPHQNR